MTDKKNDKELDELKSELASLRAEIAGLAVGLKQAAGSQAEQAHEADPREHAHDEEGHGVWADLLHKFTASKAQGEKVVKGLAAEVEQQPLVSIMVAFGLGYIIAKLWYQERSGINEDTHDAA